MFNQRTLPWLMWSLPLAFFGFQFILRLYPGLIMTEFLTKYEITATDFGVFASMYYFGYAGMQIPMALLLDKFGPRPVISLCAVVCGLAVMSTVLFPSWPVTLFCRFVIGLCSVVGFLGASKVISQWFAPEKYAKLVGLTFSFGLLGAVYGGKPTSALIDTLGWEKVFLYFGVAAVCLGIVVALFLKNKQTAVLEQKLSVATIKQLFSMPSLIVLALANFLMVGSLEGFADVWGVPYLMAAQGFTKTQAAGITSYIFIGMLFGGPVLAFFAEKLKSSTLITCFCGLLMAFLLSVFIFFNSLLSETMMMGMMFITGMLCCYQVLIFSMGSNLVPPQLLSLTVAFLNCINMLGGSFFHNVIGRLMDLFPTYSPEAYQYSLSVIPLCSLLGAILVLTYHNPYYLFNFSLFKMKIRGSSKLGE